ncbi:MAG: 4'-phosphopantetheinyl transferase superfamily protein [Limnothrix sp.]
MLNVDYWFISLADLTQAEKLNSLLSLDEQRRSQRYKFVELQQRFILGRAKLRQILGYYLKQNPRDLIFKYGKYGKPLIAEISFNFSHTKEFAACAVVTNKNNIAIGIDLEKNNRDTKSLNLAERFFAPIEFTWLRQQPIETQATNFVRLWTAKEAYLKAVGKGLQGGLDQVVVNLDNTPKLATSDDQHWTLECFQLDAEHWGAIAVNSLTCNFTFRGEWKT